MSKKVLKCGKFFDSVNECVKENVWVVVEDNKIAEVSENEVCCEGYGSFWKTVECFMPFYANKHENRWN